MVLVPEIELGYKVFMDAYIETPCRQENVVVGYIEGGFGCGLDDHL